MHCNIVNKQNIHIKKLFILYLHHYVSFVTKMLDSETKVLSFLYTDLSQSFPSPFEVNSSSEHYYYHLLRLLLLLSHTLSNCAKTKLFCLTIRAFYWVSSNYCFRFFNSNYSSFNIWSLSDFSLK